MAFRNKVLNFTGSGTIITIIQNQLVIGEIPSGAIGGNTIFTTASAVFGNSIDVYLNGALQKRTDDYNLTLGNTITFSTAPVAGSNILCDYIKA